MADAPQGLFHFPGISSILSGSFTLSHGISPSAAVITLPPQKNFAVKSGVLAITYGDTRIAFRNCRLDMASLQSDSSGQIWTVRILDRRWMWAWGSVSGWYNKRKPSGHIDTDTEKSPRELATLLLEAMGETVFDVGQLPDSVRPEVRWDYSNPAEELANLCDSLGCRVVLGTDDQVRICILGVGANLPISKVMSGGYGFDPPEMPDSLKFVAAPTQYQMKFVLEAVGLDTDGIVKPIKDLSFNPSGVGETDGWAAQHPDTFQGLIGTTKAAAARRAFAMTSVFKWYRVKEPATLDWKVPRYGKIKSINQILPLISELTEQETPAGELLPRPRSAFVEGKFAMGVGDPETFVNMPLGTRYPGSFSLDKERGIVQFANPVYQFVQCETDLRNTNDTATIVSAGSFAYFPANISLECVVNVHNYKNRSPDRYTKDLSLTNQKYGTGPKIVKRDDVALTVRATYRSLITAETYGITDITTLGNVSVTTTYDRLDVRTNEDDTAAGLNGVGTKGVKSLATYYLEAEKAVFQPKESISYSYAGLIKISPDGAIHQVSWTVGDGGATTQASRNSEFDLYVPSHDERRTLEFLRAQKESLKSGGKNA